MSKEKQLETLELMAAHEEAIGELYSDFAKQSKSKEYVDFWKTISSEESDHSKWIRDFRQKVEEGQTFIETGRFPNEAIKSSMEYVKSIKEEQLSEFKEQLAIAMDLENGLIEKRFFEVIKSDSAELRVLLDKLGNATQGHFRRVDDKMELLT